MKKWKVFDAPSWSALLSSLARIKETADTASSAVSGLGEDIAELSNLMATGLTGKQDRAKAVYPRKWLGEGRDCGIPELLRSASGWRDSQRPGGDYSVTVQPAHCGGLRTVPDL